MSKFISLNFCGGYDDFAVSKEKFTKEEAISLYIKERIGINEETEIGVCDAFVRHRAGVNEDGEPCVGWWIEYSQHKRSCPVHAFHLLHGRKKRDEYEYLTISKGKIVDNNAI